MNEDLMDMPVQSSRQYPQVEGTHIGEVPMARTRALLTERDRELIAEEGKQTRHYQAISEVRARINEELPKDIEILRKHHPELLEELKETITDHDD